VVVAHGPSLDALVRNEHFRPRGGSAEESVRTSGGCCLTLLKGPVTPSASGDLQKLTQAERVAAIEKVSARPPPAQ
jgi:hypothetical protein